LKANRDFVTKDGYTTTKELKGRATQGAYDALIADIALWLFDYQTCIDYADKVLDNELYALMPSSKFFEIYYPGNSLEGIFEFQFDQSKSQNNGIYDITNRNSYQYDPSQKALELFARDYDARELYRGEDAAIMKYASEDYIIWKYVGKAGGVGSVRSSSEQKSCNWIVYRIADVMLMKAEALSQLERFDEASLILNEIRTRADVSALALPNSKNDFEDAILNERALELAFEGKRWFDILRMGRRNNYSRKSELIEIVISNAPSTQKRILATKLTNPLGWYLPILASEIERNPALVQNPFYVN
jgi:starch-binding outer membrane protein, SusD/RagB family